MKTKTTCKSVCYKLHVSESIDENGGGPRRRDPNNLVALLRGGDLDAMCRLDHCARHERSAHLRHLPGDYSLAPNAGCGRLFLFLETLDTPGQQARNVLAMACRLY